MLLEPGKIDDVLFGNKKKPPHVTKGLLQSMQPDAYLKKNFQNMPILETQEEQNATKYLPDGFLLELDEEYAGCPTTPKLATKDKVYIPKDSKVEQFRSIVTEEEKHGLKTEKPEPIFVKERRSPSPKCLIRVKSAEEPSMPQEIPTKIDKEVLTSLHLNHDNKSPFNKKKEYFDLTKSKSEGNHRY